MDAVLTILSRASCFQKNLREQASLVRNAVRNKWLCSNMELWTVEETEKALEEIRKLVGMIPGLSGSLQMSAASFKLPFKSPEVLVMHQE